MNEPMDDAARRTWQSQPFAPIAGKAATMVEQRLREQRRQVRRFLASAAIIMPAWVAVLVWLPDLRLLASVGVCVGLALGWQIYRRTRAARPQSAGLPCAAFQVETMTRERDFHRSISRWGLVPMVVGQIVIIATLLTNDRFEKNAMFAGSLSAFIVVVVACLAFIFRRSRRMISELDREIAILERVAEA